MYVEYIGHSAVIIGTTNAVFYFTGIIAPNLWSYLSDLTGQRLAVIRYGCFLAVSDLLWPSGAWVLISLLFVFSFFLSAVLPQFEVLTLDYLGSKQAHDSGRVRLWGSIGFTCTVFIVGWSFEVLPVSVFPWSTCTLFTAFMVSSLVMPAKTALADEEPSAKLAVEEGFLKSLAKQHIRACFLSVILMQISFGPYHNFFQYFAERFRLSVDGGQPVLVRCHRR